jgi:F-type H+-transporting ATPase subunit c
MNLFIAAAEIASSVGLGVAGVGLGVGLLVFGAAKGIGNIGTNAVQSTARQPEAGNAIFLQMIISAALIEGFTFFALIVAGSLTEIFSTLAEAAH